MLTSIFLKTVRDRGLATVLMAVVLMFFTAFVMAVYAGFDDNALEFFSDMPDALQAMYGSGAGSAADIVTGAIFALLGPMIVLVSAISGASDAAIGEERRESLGLLLANPVSRRRVLLSKAAVMLVGVVLICVILGFGSALLADIVGLDLEGLDVAAAGIQLIGLAWMFGALALVLGAATGSRAAAGVASAVAIGSYLVTTLFPIEPDLAALAKWTPWYLYSGGDPLRNGVDWLKLGTMIGIAVALIAASVAMYDRRDIRG